MEGKPYMNAIGHVTRKITNIIFAVLRDNKPYYSHGNTWIINSNFFLNPWLTSTNSEVTVKGKNCIFMHGLKKKLSFASWQIYSRLLDFPPCGFSHSYTAFFVHTICRIVWYHWFSDLMRRFASKLKDSAEKEKLSFEDYDSEIRK